MNELTRGELDNLVPHKHGERLSVPRDVYYKLIAAARRGLEAEEQVKESYDSLRPECKLTGRKYLSVYELMVKEGMKPELLAKVEQLQCDQVSQLQQQLADATKECKAYKVVIDLGFEQLSLANPTFTNDSLQGGIERLRKQHENATKLLAQRDEKIELMRLNFRVVNDGAQKQLENTEKLLATARDNLIHLGACDVCWTSSWVPLDEKDFDEKLHYHRRDKENKPIRCDHCYLAETFETQHELLATARDRVKELEKLCIRAHSEFDKLMGDSDLPNDESALMKLCQDLAAMAKEAK